MMDRARLSTIGHEIESSFDFELSSTEYESQEHRKDSEYLENKTPLYILI